MTKEIKFRGWDLDAEKWRLGNLIAKPQPFIVGQMIDSCEEYCSLEFWWPVVYKSVGQFTGLKDKNGKEIFEGDILKTETEKAMVVSWNQKFASFCLDREGWAFSHWFGESCDSEFCEVVGNIYETPDLLK